jgi:hypothetical protein
MAWPNHPVRYCLTSSPITTYCHKNRRSDPAQNHLRTLVEFLEHYSKNQEKRPQYATVFCSYLVSTCWPKMRRRMHNWISQSCIYHLGSLSEDALRNGYRVWVKGEGVATLRGRRDFSLLQALEMDAYPLKSAQTSTGADQFPNLLTSLKRVMNVSQVLMTQTYNEDSCVEFHSLLMASLLEFGQALDQLAEAQSQRQNQGSSSKGTGEDGCANNSIGGSPSVAVSMKSQLSENTDHPAMRASSLAALLWNVVHSRMLRFHLDMLSSSDLLPNLSRVDETHRRVYLTYTGFRVSLPTDASQAVEKDREPEKENNDVEDDSGEVDDEEVASASDPRQKQAYLLKMYLRRLRLHASHFEALNILTRFAATETPTNFKFILLAVKGKSCEMMGWRKTIELAISSTDSEAEFFNPSIAFDTLQLAIRNGHSSPDVPTLLKMYRQKGSGEIPLEFKGAMHCETVLASLMMSRGSVVGSAELEDLVTVGSSYFRTIFVLNLFPRTCTTTQSGCQSCAVQSVLRSCQSYVVMTIQNSKSGAIMRPSLLSTYLHGSLQTASRPLWRNLECIFVTHSRLW